MNKEIKILNSAIIGNFKRITNQIYKLLPSREEGKDWQTPLETVIEELYGMFEILIENQESLFSLVCKLNGLFHLTEEDDFLTYRRIIFECLSLLNKVKVTYEKECDYYVFRNTSYKDEL